MGQISCLISELRPLRRAARHSTTQNNLATMGKIVGVIGRASEDEQTATVVVQDLIELCRRCTLQNLAVLLKEIEGRFNQNLNEKLRFFEKYSSSCFP